MFRHAVATLMLHGGAHIRYIQALLGHESLATTQVYAHVAIGKLCEVHARTHPAELARVPEPDTDPAAPTTGHDLPDDDDDDPDFPWVPIPSAAPPPPQPVATHRRAPLGELGRPAPERRWPPAWIFSRFRLAPPPRTRVQSRPAL